MCYRKCFAFCLLSGADIPSCSIGVGVRNIVSQSLHAIFDLLLDTAQHGTKDPIRWVIKSGTFELY